MQRLEWSENLMIGIGILDQQHREIMGQLNGLIDAFNSGVAPAGPSEMMALLLQVTEGHFNYEEAIMLDHGFPGYERHKHLHGEFLKKLEEFVEELREEAGPVPEWLLVMLRSWFVDHVVTDDVSFREFVRAKEGAVRKPPDPSTS